MQAVGTNPGKAREPKEGAPASVAPKQTSGGQVTGHQTSGGRVASQKPSGGTPSASNLVTDIGSGSGPNGDHLSGAYPSLGTPGSTNSAGLIDAPDPLSAWWLILATFMLVLSYAADKFSREFQWWVQTRSKYKISLELPDFTILFSTLVMIAIFMICWMPLHPELSLIEPILWPSLFGKELSTVPMFVAGLLFALAIMRFSMGFLLAAKMSTASNASKLRQGGPGMALGGGILSLTGLVADIFGIWGALKP